MPRASARGNVLRYEKSVQQGWTTAAPTTRGVLYLFFMPNLLSSMFMQNSLCFLLNTTSHWYFSRPDVEVPAEGFNPLQLIVKKTAELEKNLPLQGLSFNASHKMLEVGVDGKPFPSHISDECHACGFTYCNGFVRRGCTRS